MRILKNLINRYSSLKTLLFFPLVVMALWGCSATAPEQFKRDAREVLQDDHGGPSAEPVYPLCRADVRRRQLRRGEVRGRVHVLHELRCAPPGPSQGALH